MDYCQISPLTKIAPPPLTIVSQMSPEGCALGETVPLASIVTLPEMQPRDKGLNLPTLRRYKQAMEAGEVFPPILLARVNGALVLVDGWHRLEAMRALGEWQVVAVVREARSMAEARLWGYEANRKHGLPLTKAELREMFRVYIKAGRHRKHRRGLFKSYREMGEELGIPKSTLAEWTRRDAPALAKALAKGNRFGGTGRGGAREAFAERRLAGEAHRALDEAGAAIPGVVDAEERRRLLDKVRGLVEALEGGDLQTPMF